MRLLLTLSEFATAAAAAVQASGAAPDNRQAKPIPAERMVRYYTARGLLPRPGTRGRALTYGRTHLIRLVAIKRLQGRGLSLDEIAQRLEGMSAEGVESLAAIPPSAMPAGLGDPETDPDPDSGPDSGLAPARAAGRFWQAVPNAATEAPVVASEPSWPAVANLHAVRLSDSVTLLIDGPVESLPAPDTLRRAAAPLLDLLAASRKDAQ